LLGAVKSGFSVNHGAGRRLSRGQASRTLSQRHIDDQYAAAGILVNLDGHVPLDEAAPAHKSSEEVLLAVTEAGLAAVEHKLWPLASLKGVEERRRGKGNKRNKRSDRHH
jgi:tRNA-splicing ligase RtcB